MQTPLPETEPPSRPPAPQPLPTGPDKPTARDRALAEVPSSIEPIRLDTTVRGKATARLKPRRPRRRRRFGGRRVAVVVLAIVCVSVVGAAWMAVRGISARDHLQRAAALVQQLRGQLQAGDPATAATLAALQRETGAARADTEDPVWRLGARLPVFGDELVAVRTLAGALDDLAREGLPALAAIADETTVEDLAPRNGRVDLRPLQRAAPGAAQADAAVRRARDRVAGIPVDGMVEPVRSAVTDLQRHLERAAALTSLARRSTAVLPTMLGGHGARTYLVLFQNSAEIRATGGMPGAYVVVRADQGRIDIVDQGTANGLGVFRHPVKPVKPSDAQLYGERLATFPANINLTPHFPTAAELAREMYQRRTGRAVDGVLATDPIALSYLLRVTGPVPVPGGPDLTADSAVPELLARTYARTRTSTEQDVYFGAAARATFDALMGRKLDVPRLVAELARAAGERRILVWSTEPQENRLLAGTVLTGVMATDDGNRPTVGVFLNDGSAAKLSYYLRQSAELSVLPGCRADGRRELLLRVTLSSRAPRSGLSEHVLGPGLAGDPYTVRTLVLIYSPTGGGLVNTVMDGARKPFAAGMDGRRAVGIVTVDLPPGATRTLDVRLRTEALPPGMVEPQLWTTPAATSWHSSVRTEDGCRNKG